MQTVFVTGANGFVGAYVVKALLERNYFVVASGRGKNGPEYNHPNLRYRALDFTDKEMTATVFYDVRPNVVVHCGAMSKPDDCELNKAAAVLTNVAGTRNLLDEAGKLKAHFIFLSTDFVFSGEGEGMYKEDDERSPVNYYGQTKVLAENEVMNYVFDWAIVRTVLVYGKSLGEKESFIEMVVRSAKQQKALKIFNDQLRTPTYVADLAGGIERVIAKKATGIFHLSGKDPITVYQAACNAVTLNNLDASFISPITEGDLPAPARRPKITGFYLDKAKRELSYNPVSFADGLQKTFELNASS
ncbi:MAG: SDR family oxidoreductase [Chitinophagaceae bacterium]|nr:MAG: SDR family oxidoreductase [Chitinophagaceae bacterium]